jgi:thioredoxin-dependent peroxiredoxin
MLKEGDQAIDFCLDASNGQKISLSDFRGKNVVLYFYPKDDTPGCTTQACDFRDFSNLFSNFNTVILGVSRDPIVSHERFIQKYHLPFLLLSDSNAEVCKQYGVLKEKTMFGKTSMGIERSTFIINQSGKIIKMYRQVKVQDHVEEITRFIEGIS